MPVAGEESPRGGGASAPAAPERAAPTVAHQAARSTALRRLAAVGLAGYGVVHLLVAWLALQLAWYRPGGGDGGRTADPSGAVAVLAGSPAGPLLLWVLAAGLTGLTLWQAAEVLRSRRALPRPGRDRRAAVLQVLRTLGSAAVYGWLCVLTVRAATSGGASRGDEERSVRGVLALPGGQLLVLGAAVVLVVIGGYQAQKGWRTRFLDELDLDAVPPQLRRASLQVCRAGFVGKGTAFVVVGLVVGWAAVLSDAERANGLDGALRAVASTPAGPWLLTAVAAGVAAFSVYCFTRARHPVS